MAISGLTRRTAAAVLFAGAFALGVSGCTVSANLTVQPESVAEAAADALEDSVGSRPEMDCGSDSIDLTEGNTVVCELTDPSTGSKFDSMVTLREVSGSSFAVDVEVSSTPKS